MSRSRTDLGTDEILDLLKKHNEDNASMPLPDMSKYSQPMGMDQDKSLSTPDPMTAAIQAAPSAVENAAAGTPAFPLPNGGLVGQQLADYIKANPGPVATTGKNLNLPDKQDDSDDEDDEDTKPATPLKKLASKLKAARTPAASPSPAMAAAQPVNVNDTIAKLLGGQNDQMNAAQASRNTNQLFANLAKAGNQIGASLAHTTPNNEVLNDLEKQSGQPVTDLATKQAMEGEALKQAETKSKLKTDLEKDDPNSAISKQYRDAAEKMLGKKLDPNMSASALERVNPIYEKIWASTENAKNRKADSENKRAQRDSDKQSQAVQQVTQLIAGARMSPEVRQAKMDMYNAAKAKSLINMYDDPNKLSPDLVGLVTLEVSKVAKGGVPDKEEFALLNNPTVRKGMANIISKVTNNPSPANAGAFLKQYEDYMNRINDDAREAISQQYNTVLNPNRKRLGEENYSNIRKETDQDLKKYESKKQNSSHPQDDEAVAWAKSNSSDPRAAKILKANGL